MASDVNELQRALDRINKLSAHQHAGASDRKRSLQTIIGMAKLAIETEKK